MVLVDLNGTLSFYTGLFDFNYGDNVEMRLFKDGESSIKTYAANDYVFLKDCDELKIQLNGFGTQRYYRKYKITDELTEELRVCDSFYIRCDGKISKFICK